MRPGLALPLALVLMPAFVLAAEKPNLAAAKALLEAKCSDCHSLDRTLKKRKDRAGWEKTVSRMIRYAAGRISDAEAATIVEYLVRVREPED